MVGVASSQPKVLHLSLVVGGALRDSAGERLGRVDDLIVRLGEPGYPPITGFLVNVAARQAYLPAERVAAMDHGAVTLREPKLDLRRFERRPEEVLLKEDVLDHQLINVDGARLVRANEIELARLEGWWRVVGVDTGPRGGFRRLLPKPAGRRVSPGAFLDWASVEPFVGHVPSVKLRVPHPKLAKLHPAQIADLVEAASHREGEEILHAVRTDDRELEADVFEELDDQHQLEFIENRSDQEVGQVVARMAPDDAADLVTELGEDRREAVLSLVPAGQRTKIRALLGYDPAEAGGLMSPDFVSLYRQATVEEALERVRMSGIAEDLLTTVFVMDSHKRLEGAIPLATLVRAAPEASLVDLVHRDTPRLIAAADFEEVARVMADYNLTAAPVVDEEQRMIGVITVDDVLEAMLPKGWRRRFGLLGED
ncbi:MAG TPA: CBS domain-containing protein [Thermoleophilaceae bacterium]|nr:CBS domain-containing protein [Thermoleophilaceae bacterium]